jgi:uncharacterized protein
MSSKTELPKGKRGFAAMSPERCRELASKGGKAVPKEKRSFFISPELASKAGRIGGQAVDPAKRSFAKDNNLARSAAKQGGLATHRRAISEY